MPYIKCLFLLLIHIFIPNVLTTISIVDKGMLPLARDSVAIQFFVDVENEDRKETCNIYSKIKKCCLIDSDEEDCDTVSVFSETINTIQPKDRYTLLHVFPMLHQHDLIGYCEIVVIYRCLRKQAKLKIHIPFDTTMQTRNRYLNLFKDYIGNAKLMECLTLDQNSLDRCSSTDCDLKYFGKRPFYDVNINRCIKTPICLGDIDNELPDIVYDPKINICKDLSLPLSFRDIYSMSTGLGTVTPADNSDKFKVRLKSNCTTISQNLFLLKDLMYGKLCPCGSDEEINFKDDCKSAVFSILFCIISVCALLFSFVCCVNTFVWMHRQWLNGNIENFLKIIRIKFKRTKKMRRKPNRRNVRNTLLREVIVKDIPLELRDSIISICDRVEKEVHNKNRYRKSDIGSQISLQKNRRVSLSTDSSSDEYTDSQPLVK